MRSALLGYVAVRSSTASRANRHRRQSFDGGWIIGPHPSLPASLFLTTGGFMHTYKNLPCAGKYIVDALESKLAPELREAWAWRPERIPEGFVPESLYGINDLNLPAPKRRSGERLVSI
ncbi:hypothetical protein DFH07DRAFT_774013 [Mycena maculata]|uniref:Uncharacterized protein n=1 Tax=Mycena maculata TaxID=230809 RepID=A0AAD7NBA7_9AGAR|nr:hypothetical protein DFH07DRAFT_774013 [Mycena maculata]